ncbi:ferrous iron transporter B [Sandaracinobacter sp. RS1-74]|uniref:ferrous iron transporter B n=1 Tax=Sandaracinobacteroides sayramensis TaxID=2913411 RepID=UPI001EDA9BF2|nr:ferrous iron transporter B [Sandaracinobacteroides sayramensis]MCG2842652.1 ferrous iron transporter B [Sandaracinobacteroides sayramensis]
MADVATKPAAPATQRAPLVALVGHPNAGKTSLFNALSGARQKVGNYPGVTVERKTAEVLLPSGAKAELIDLPGAYGLVPRSLDETVTRDTLLGKQPGERLPDAVLLVTDATNLSAHLRLALDVLRLGIPAVMALNRMDMATRDGLVLDSAELARQLGIPVVETVAVRKRGIASLLECLEAQLATKPAPVAAFAPAPPRELGREARRITRAVTRIEGERRRATRAADRILLHPVAGPIILAALLFFMFQAVFSWAEAPMGWIEELIAWLQGHVTAWLPEGFVRSFLNDGILAGVGSVIVFLPQILILFTFILILEGSGYMVRAAFLMDRLMASVGLNGSAFIPLLSSFACAIPGIMATRTIPDARDRLTTILIAPLMTCSARLPVYAVIIAAFIPAEKLWGLVGLQGLVLFILYIAGILGAMAAALFLRRTVTKGPKPTFLMEMPAYQLPVLRDILVGLWLRAGAFLKRAGTIIMGVTIALWLLASYPAPPADADRPAVEYSIAGRIGHAIEPLVRPIGFNHEIAMSLLPAMAAREVAVAALATIYSLDADDEDTTGLVDRLRGSWPLPTALAFLAWFVFAPQCLSTLAVVRRETGGWKWPLFMFGYLMVMAYAAAGVTYWAAKALL